MQKIAAWFRSKSRASKFRDIPISEPPKMEASAFNDSSSHSEKQTGIKIKHEEGTQANIIVNHDFSKGLDSWHANSCEAFVVSGETSSSKGNYAVLTKRKECWQGLEQDITGRVVRGRSYTVCADVGVSGLLHGSADVQATLKLELKDSATSYLFIARTSVTKDQWGKLEGSFTLENLPDRIVFYIEGPSPGIDLKIKSVVVFCPTASDFDKPTGIKIKHEEGTRANIIVNHDFSKGLDSWHANSCEAFVVSGETSSSKGNYAVLTKRKECWQGLEQDITGRVVRGRSYTVCADVGVSGLLHGSADVQATLKLELKDSATSYLFIARTSITKDQWGKLEGSFTLENLPDRIVFYIEGPSPGIDLKIKSVVVFCPTASDFDKPTGIKIKHEEGTRANIIVNHDFSKGLDSWQANSCEAFVVSGETSSSKGNYAVLTNRKECWQGLEQDITGRVVRGRRYTVCADVGVSGLLHGSADVQATLKLENKDSATSYLFIARTSVTKDQWGELEGTFILENLPDQIVFYIEGPSPGIDLKIKSVFVFCPTASDFDVRINEPEKGKGTGYVREDDEGNIILNPVFDDGLKSWSGRGCKIVKHDSLANGKIFPKTGKFFAVSTERTHTWNGIQQEITGRVQRKLAYEVTALVRIFGNVSSADVRATLWVQTPDLREQYIGIANTQVTDKDWVKLQGKFVLNGTTSKVIIYLEGPPPGSDILLDSFVVKHARKALPPLPPPIEHAAFGVNIITNSTFIDGTNGWFPLGNCNLSVGTDSPLILPTLARGSLGPHELLSGNYVLTTNRTQNWMGPAQMVTDKVALYLTYQVSGWVRVSSIASGAQTVNVAIGVDDQWVNGGQVEVGDNTWHEISGSFRIEKRPGKVMMYVQGPSPGVDLMVACLQIFPVDRRKRFKHLCEQTDKVRKRDVILKFSDSICPFGTFVKVRQIENTFPFGACLSRSNIDNENFVDFFLKHFNWAVFGNELKWNWTEPQKGSLNYKDADDLLNFCKTHNIKARGHCIFWDVDETVQSWVKALNKNDLSTAVQNRLTGLLSRYKGQFEHYDVNNEMLHGSFYVDRLGKDIRANMFKTARQLDPSPILFVNDYHIEDRCDLKSSPERYIHHILDLLKQGAPIGGIGIQGHIDSPIGPIICSALDKLGVLGLPIWFTELDVSSSNEHVRAEDLEVMLRELFAHPAVDGIMLWGFWELFMSRENAHLVNAEGDINEAGKRFINLKKEWLSMANGNVDKEGHFEFRGFQGRYEVEIFGQFGQVSREFCVSKGTSRIVIPIDL